MAAPKKPSQAASRRKSSGRMVKPSSIPVDPLLFSRMLLGAKDDRSLERIANEYIARGQQTFQPRKTNPLAEAFYQLKDTLGIAYAPMWNQFVSVAGKILQLRTYTYYPYDNVPVAPLAKPYDKEFYIQEEPATAVGPLPGNPDN